MSAIDEPASLQRLWAARTHGRSIVVGGSDAMTGSRIGGAPPGVLASSPPRCPRCGGPLEYLLTLADDTLGATITQNRALSVLFCRDTKCLSESHVLAEPSSILVTAHEDSPRAADPGELASRSEGRGLSVGPEQEDPTSDAGIVLTDDSKVGGRPGYLQRWGEREGAKCTQQGGGFLFQFSELSYPHGMKHGKYAFLCGIVYVFSRIDPAGGLPELAGVQAFWQNT